MATSRGSPSWSSSPRTSLPRPRPRQLLSTRDRSSAGSHADGWIGDQAGARRCAAARVPGKRIRSRRSGRPSTRPGSGRTPAPRTLTAAASTSSSEARSMREQSGLRRAHSTSAPTPRRPHGHVTAPRLSAGGSRSAGGASFTDCDGALLKGIPTKAANCARSGAVRLDDQTVTTRPLQHDHERRDVRPLRSGSDGTRTRDLRRDRPAL
jgi:hypothetical protein